MGSYKVEIKKSVSKDFEKLNKSIVSQILQKIEALSDNPRPAQTLKLKGTENSYRLRVGNYRVVYQIDDATRTITVFGVGHRKDIYRNM